MVGHIPFWFTAWLDNTQTWPLRWSWRIIQLQLQPNMNPPPIHQVDGRYELQELCGALSTEKDDTLRDDRSLTVTDKPLNLHDKFFREAGDSSETSLRDLERPYEVTSKPLKTSLEVPEYTHHNSERFLSDKTSTPSSNGPSQTPSLIGLIEESSSFPLPPTPSDDIPLRHPPSITLPLSLSKQNNSTESK